MPSKPDPDKIIWDTPAPQQPDPSAVVWDTPAPPAQPPVDRSLDPYAAEMAQYGAPVGPAVARPPVEMVEGVPRWAIESPTLYGAYGAGKALQTAAGNVPGSTGRLGANIAQVVRHPVQTAGALGAVALGGIEKLIPDEQKHEATFNAVVDALRQQYGGIDEINRYAIDDPVLFATDVASILTGVGAGVKAVGAAGKISSLTKAGAAAQAASKALDPIGIATRAIRPVARAGARVGRRAGGVGAEVLGVSTGAGRESILQAARGSKQFKAAMRGDIPGDDIVKSARHGMQVLKEQRAFRYAGQLDEISKVRTKLDLTPLRSAVNDKLKRFNIKRTSDGGLDFSRSVIRKTARVEVEDMVALIDDWGSQADDLTPASIDVLKRSLDDFYSESSKARSMAADLRSKTRQVLVDGVDGYERMVRDYEKASRIMNEMDITLSLKKGRTPEQVLRKLTTGLREDMTFKRDFIRILEDASGEDIMAKIAGNLLNRPLPTGGLSKLLGAGELAFLYHFNPMLVPIMLANSPRAVGEFFATLGKPIGIGAKAVPTAVTRGARPAFYAGRAAERAQIPEEQ